jgi:phosphoglycolate phosphatase
VLLDFDGTLVATHAAVVECVRRTSDELGHGPVERERVSKAIARGLPLPETFATVIQGLTPHQIAHCVDVYRELYGEMDVEHSELFAGVRTTVSAIQQAGLRLAVLSNKGSVAIARALRRFGLASFVDCVLAADPGLPTKPNPALFDRRVVPAFPTTPRSGFLMVGDTSADILFAKTIGIRNCWARYGYGDPIACRELVPDYEIGCFAELLSILTLRENSCAGESTI